MEAKETLLKLNYGLHNDINSVCGVKVQFKTFDEAERVLKLRNYSEKKCIYLCPYCGHYHYGADRSHKNINKLPRKLGFEHIYKLKIDLSIKNELENKFFEMVERGWNKNGLV
jgi:hypothetical protein